MNSRLKKHLGSRNITILFLVPLDDYIIEILGLEAYEECGFNVRCLDIYSIIFPHLAHTHKRIYSDSRLIRVDTREALFELLADAPQILIPFIPFFEKTKFFYRWLKEMEIPFLSYHVGDAPTKFPITGSDRIKRAWKKLLKPDAWKKALSWRLEKLWRQLSPNAYSSPLAVFAGINIEIAKDVFLYAKNDCPVIPSVSLDYDRYLSARKKYPGKTGTCAYIASNPFHRVEAKMFNTPEISMQLNEEHFYRMRQLLDRIEQQSGLRVIIAGHPRHGPSPEQGKAWYGRETIVGETARLVTQSDLALTRGSMAVGHAISNRIPVVFFYDSITFGESHARLAQNGAALLGTEALDVGQPELLKNFKVDDFPVNEDLYRKYEYAHLRHPDAPEKHSWEIFCDYLMSLPDVPE